MSKSADRAARTEVLREQQRKAEQKRRMVIIGSVVAVLIVIVGVSAAVFAMQDSSGEEVTADGTPAGVEGYGVVVGDASAPTTITIYEDLQCPICQAFEQATGEQVNAAVEAGDVKLDYRMVSFLDGASDNEYSSRAMNALLATLDTAGVDAFKSLHDELFANQPAEGTAGPEDDELIDAAVDAGATESEIRPLIEDKAFEQWIKNATDQMSKDGVSGTPTVEIDGERQEGSVQESIDAVLAALQ